MKPGIINRRRALQAIGVAALAPTLVQSAHAAGEPFHIFFNYGEAEPPASAKPIVDALRSTLKKNSKVTFTGHCDTSEPNAGALGMTRAVAVLKAMTEAALPADVQLTVVSKAATSLLIKTAANVREPQNRRVAILIT